MRFSRGMFGFGLLLLVAAAPLQAQFTTYGCPAGASQSTPLNGFTAGSQSDAQICMQGSSSAWIPSLGYLVTVTDTLTHATAQATNVAAYSTSLLIGTIPHGFFASVQNSGQPDPVSISVQQQSPSAPPPVTGTFQINPPLTGGGPIFVNQVNQPVSWDLYTGGTGPFSNQFINGTIPAGMTFPAANPTWTGTPTQTGVFSFQMGGVDSWSDGVTQSLFIYIVPKPQITSLSVASAVVGAPNQTIDILGPNTGGFGFVSPITINSTPQGGSVVSWSTGIPTPTILTVNTFASNDLNVTIPANLLTTTGIHNIIVTNPASSVSNAAVFTVNPSITGLSTNSRTAGTAAFQLTVTGAGFVNGSVVRMNTSPLPTTFVNATTLTATFPSVAQPATELITVVNPDTTVTPTPQNLVVLQPPALNSINPGSVNAGNPSFNLTLTGSRFQNGMTVYFNSAPVPTTLFNNQKNDTLIANIPASAVTTAGTVPVTAGTLDGFLTPAFSFTINTTGPPPLQLLTLSLPSGVVGVAYSTTLQANQGAGGYVFSLTNGTLPAGLQFSAAGIISGTPTAFGASQFTVQVADSAQSTVSRTFTLTIAPAPLQITTGPLANTQINTPVSVQFAGTGGIPPYTFVEFGTLPAGVSFSNTGLLSGTPTKTGSFPFTVFLNDTTQASARQNYTLNVALPGLLITPPSPLPAGQINVPYTTPLSATGGVGSPFFWSATGLPNGLTIANNSGLIAGIPRAAGTFSVAVTVSDSAGATDTQTYALTIAASTLSINSPPLPNGAVGSSYNAGVSATGGSGNYTFTATGLPAGVTLSASGILSGTPTTAGTFSVVVTATDAAAAGAALTASATYKVVIAPQLVLTTVAIPNGVVGTAISPVQMAATGGTPPYQFQSGNLPAGLVLASNGTLSGTPTAAGSFSFPVFVTDSSGALANGTEKVTIGLPSAPAVTITGLPASTAPATQQFAQVTLSSPFPATVTANLTMTFAPTSGADDPAVQFATGGRTAQVVVPAGSTTGLSAIGVQTGTVAGLITVTAQLSAGSVDVTPTPAPSQTIRVTAGAPVITSVTATRTSNGFTVTVIGFASNRGVDGATFTFSPSVGSTLQTSTVTTTDTSLFTTWYTSAASAPFGSQFLLTQPFTVSGSPSSILSVAVTLTNALGTSPAATANLQ